MTCGGLTSEIAELTCSEPGIGGGRPSLRKSRPDQGKRTRNPYDRFGIQDHGRERPVQTLLTDSLGHGKADHVRPVPGNLNLEIFKLRIAVSHVWQQWGQQRITVTVHTAETFSCCLCCAILCRLTACIIWTKHFAYPRNPILGRVNACGTSMRPAFVGTLGFAASPVLARTRKANGCYIISSKLSISGAGNLVGTERFELSTYGLRVRCSTS